MKFLCGRPGCGRESTATLQIDALNETVSIVDPKVSRDGVPLCPNHADGTTPPLGWAMNDLRSTSQALSVDASKEAISSTPPRVRPEADDEPGDSSDEGSGGRQRRTADARRQARLKLVSGENDDRSAGRRHMSQRQSIKARAGQGDGVDGEAIESRPTRRRETADQEQAQQESFPWSFDFDDEDEPEELQASTPLLSRAFRSGSR